MPLVATAANSLASIGGIACSFQNVFSWFCWLCSCYQPCLDGTDHSPPSPLLSPPKPSLFSFVSNKVSSCPFLKHYVKALLPSNIFPELQDWVFHSFLVLHVIFHISLTLIAFPCCFTVIFFSFSSWNLSSLGSGM